MRVKTRSLIRGLLACLLLLSFVSVIHADDTRFTLKDGVIDDSELGLEWVPAPDRVMTRYLAEEYALNLRLAGGGWRLPTMEELQSLYDKSRPGGVDPKFHVSNCWVWTSKLQGPSGAWGFDFRVGFGGRDAREYAGTGCVLAVRSRL